MRPLRRSTPLLFIFISTMLAGACSGSGAHPDGAPPQVTSSAFASASASVSAAAPASVSASAPAAAPASASASAPALSSPEALALQRATLATSRAFETVRSLVDEAGPRLAGSPGNDAAVAWALRTMPALGLSNVRAERVMVPRWERGSESVEIVAPSRRKLAALALGGSVPTPTKGLEAEVIEVASLVALEAMDKAKVTGKIVFFSAKMERARDGSGYPGAARIRVFGPSRAAKLGAVGVVIRSAGTDNNRLPHTGVLVYDPAAPKVPAAALSSPDAELLARLLAAGKPVRLRMALNSKNLPDAASANVVGDVPGATAPDEVVLLGAHLDSWDVGMGAQDDAAGCAVVLEAARQIALLPNSSSGSSSSSSSKRPRRTVRVVLFNNEENGGAGSAAYAKEHAAELSRHVAAIEADLGAGRVFAVRYLGGESGRPAFEALAGLLAPLGIEVRPEPARGGADVGPLRAAGVPVIDLFQDLTTYFDIHHTENDTLDKIRKEDLDQVAAAFATAAFALADGEGDLGRVPEDKRVERR